MRLLETTGKHQSQKKKGVLHEIGNNNNNLAKLDSGLDESPTVMVGEAKQKTTR